MEAEEIKMKQKRVMIYTLIVSLICVVGVSYAFFTAGMSSETSTTVRADAGTMKITYSGGANIDLAGIYPKDDVWATKTITVTGNNTTDAEMYYKLTLVVDSNTFKTDDPLQYELVSTNTSTNGEIIPNISKTDITGTSIELGSGHFVKANNAKHTYLLKIYYPKKVTSQNANQGAAFSAHVEITSAKAPTASNLAGTILANNEVKAPITTPGKESNAYTKDDIVDTSTKSVDTEYQAYYITYGTGYEADGIWLNLTGVAVTSDTYANSYSSLVGKYLPYSSLERAGSSTAGEMTTTTDLFAVYYVVSATQNSFTYKILHSIKNTTEALLASTEDDYGTSYYFRGTVKNNYVEFANKCWRIVRVGGDGSVKLILHNDNPTGAANPCDTANNSATAAFARYNTQYTDYHSYTSKFNPNYDDNAYVGFKYGIVPGCENHPEITDEYTCKRNNYTWKGSTSYAEAHANTNNSIILNNLETWYDKNNLKDYEKVIADTAWCNDKTIVKDTTYNPWTFGGNATGLGYAENVTYYGATQRLVNKSGDAGGTGPSLKCTGELSKITSKVGLITADELAFAGYAYDSENPTTYLQENATGSWWWSLSPDRFNGLYAFVFIVNGYKGSLYNNSKANETGGVRPSISLKSTTNVTGDGTSSSPFVVKI